MSNELSTHPLCDAFPDMTPGEFDDLVASIGSSGQREDIVLLGGQILDGKHRYKACRKLGIPPSMRPYDPAKDGANVSQFVADRNLFRRNLTASQRVTVGKELWDAIKAEHETVARGTGRLRDQAAKLAGVSSGNIAKAAKLEREEPELYQHVKDGTITLEQALRKANPNDDVRALTADTMAAKHGDEFAGEIREGKILQGKWLREFSELPEDRQRAIVPLVRNGWNPVTADKFDRGEFAGTDTLDDLIRLVEWRGGDAELEFRGFLINIQEA